MFGRLNQQAIGWVCQGILSGHAAPKGPSTNMIIRILGF